LESDARARLERERAFARREGAPNRRARERVEELLDAGSFLEVGLLARDVGHGRESKTPTDGLIAGYGTVGGHRAGVVSHDKAVLGGSTGMAATAKAMRVLDQAFRCGFPIVCFGEGGGGRIPDLMGSAFGVPGSIGATTFLARLARRDRPSTLIACCMDEMYGDPAFTLGLADFPLMLRSACFGISGPPVVEQALGEKTTGPELGGPQVHEANGQVARVEETESELLAAVKRLVSFTVAPRVATSDPDDRPTPEIERLVPDSPSRAYDVRRVLEAIVDRDCPPLYLWPGYGGSLVTAFARLGGRTVAVLASQPLVRGGVLDADASRKGVKMMDQAHRLGVPLLFLADLPGVMVGRAAERQGLVSAAMDYLRALVSCAVPKLTLVLHKAYGFGYFAMGGPGFTGDYVAALPGARIAFMGPQPGIHVVHARRLAQIEDAAERERTREALLADWARRAEPWEAAYAASLDEVLAAAEARPALVRALRRLERGDRDSVRGG